VKDNLSSYKTPEAKAILRAAFTHMLKHMNDEGYGGENLEGWSILAAIRFSSPTSHMAPRYNAERLAMHVTTLNEYRSRDETREYALEVLLHAAIMCGD
jgi:hypothetical protein